MYLHFIPCSLDQNLKGKFRMMPFYYAPEIRFAPLTKQLMCLEACKTVLKCKKLLLIYKITG